MSVTNAISGIVAVGGLHLMGGGLFPSTMPQLLAAAAVFMATINIFGGFSITQRMLEMFRRPNDPPEFSHLYGIPGILFTVGYLASAMAGLSEVHQMAYLASSLFCVLSLGGLSSQTTSRLGNVLGMIGVTIGLAATFGSLSVPLSVYTQMGWIMGIAATIGYIISRRVAITDLPQLVAAFHSFVGLAAVLTSIASFMVDAPTFATAASGLVHKIAIFAGTLIGGITFTGSIVAFCKLQGLMPSRALHLPGRNSINLAMALAELGAFGVYLSSYDPTLGLSCLTAITAISFAQGWHLTDSIGGADMPVVITVLNSYSGWAICAEGFMLGNDLLTITGALIGSSGAILSYIMCKAMNRSIISVIFGGY